MTFFQQLLMMIWYCNTNGYCTACVIAQPNLVSWLEWFFFSLMLCILLPVWTASQEFWNPWTNSDLSYLSAHEWLKYCPFWWKFLSFSFSAEFMKLMIHFYKNIQFPCSECNCGSAALARRTLESCSTHSGRAHWCLWLHWFPRSPY